MAQYTKKAILQTFQEMLEKKPFDKITVSSIVAKCEISSNTFYYHFRDIYDLLDTWLQIKKEDYQNSLSEEASWQEHTKVLLQDLKEHSDLVYHLFNSMSREQLERCVFESSDDTFYRLICRKMEGIDIPEEELRAVTEYNSYSFLGFLLKFLWNNMNSDIDEGLEKIAFVFESNLQGLKEKYIQK